MRRGAHPGERSRLLFLYRPNRSFRKSRLMGRRCMKLQYLRSGTLAVGVWLASLASAYVILRSYVEDGFSFGAQSHPSEKYAEGKASVDSGGMRQGGNPGINPRARQKECFGNS